MRFTLRLVKDVYDALSVEAKAQNRSLHQQVVHILQEHVSKTRQTDKQAGSESGA